MIAVTPTGSLTDRSRARCVSMGPDAGGASWIEAASRSSTATWSSWERGPRGWSRRSARPSAARACWSLEKNRRPGVKILMSGGTRCNITNARGLRRLESSPGRSTRPTTPRGAGAPGIQQAFGAGGKFLGPALRHLDVEQTVALFEAEGVATKVEGNGKVFPVSDRAVDVLDALLRRLERSGADAPRPEPRPLGRAARGSDDDGFALASARRTLDDAGG